MQQITEPTSRSRRSPASLWQPCAELAADLEAAYAALPPPARTRTPSPTRGAAGAKLQAHHISTIPEALLQDFARNTLGAQRLNVNYLAALRVVLGNQARADREGVDLELNHDVPFASARTMRTIIGQMRATGITTGKTVSLGHGKCQEIQCFRGEREPRPGWPDRAEELEWRYRRREGETRYDADLPAGLRATEVPDWPHSLTTQ